jgi:DNA uptake protein ComE-like DNA-binding protein
MKDFLKEFFHYTRSERNGMFVLTAICVALLITPSIYKHFFKKENKTDFCQFQNQINAFYQNINSEDTSISVVSLFQFNPNTATTEDFQKLGLSKKVASTIENYRNKGGKFYKKEDFKKIYGISETDYERLKNYISIDDRKRDFANIQSDDFEAEMTFELFEFDPNTVSKEDLKRLGLSKRAVNVMINYRKKGGTFRKREDLSKIYGITEDDFERLFPYIKIPEKEPNVTFASIETSAIPKSYENTAPVKIEINTASPEEWQQLRGIGPYYSKNICWFRDKLGGFVSIEQIAETNKLPDSTFQNIKPFLLLNQPVKKIDLNAASAKDFAVHPYLKWSQANAIVKYRDQHGNFTNIDQLENIKILDKQTLYRIKPYLRVE